MKNENENVSISYNGELNKDMQKFIDSLKSTTNTISYTPETNKNDEPKKPEPNQTAFNFYGCSFNFGKEGCADSKYYYGDDVYIPQNERM